MDLKSKTEIAGPTSLHGAGYEGLHVLQEGHEEDVFKHTTYTSAPERKTVVLVTRLFVCFLSPSGTLGWWLPCSAFSVYCQVYGYSTG